VGAVLVWLAGTGSALALNLDVDTIVDIPSAQACTAAANDCSLRGAIIKANAVAGQHTIAVPAGTYSRVLLGATGSSTSCPAAT
jgi:hypothetical protein